MANQRRSNRPRGVMSISSWRKLAGNRTFYWILAMVIAVPVVISFSGCPGGGGRQTQVDDRANETVFTVNGQAITRSEYDAVWNEQRRQQQVTEAESAMPQGQVVQSLVSLGIVRAVAKSKGIQVTDADVDRALTETRAELGSKDKPLSDEDLLKRTGKESIDDVRAMLRERLLPEVLGTALSGAARLTESDLAASFDELKIRHILIGVTGTPSPLKGALPDALARTRAEKILAEARAGKDFAALANQYTSDPSNAMPSFGAKGAQTRPKGGDLGWYKRGGGFDPAFETAAFALKPNEIGGPVKTPYGYHIIKVEQMRRTLPADYEKTKVKLLADLRRRKASEAVGKLIEAERSKAKPVFKDAELEWKYLYARVGYTGMYAMPGAPVTADQTLLLAKLRAALKKNASDTSAAFVLGRMLYQQYMSAGVAEAAARRGSSPAAPAPPASSANRDALRTEALQVFETALNHGEDRRVRFDVARMYQEAKQDARALAHYQELLKQLKWDDSAAAKNDYILLQAAFRQMNRPDLMAQATARVAELTAREQKEAADRALQAARDKADKAVRDREAREWLEKHKKDDAGKPGSATAPAPAGTAPAAPATKPAPEPAGKAPAAAPRPDATPAGKGPGAAAPPAKP